MIKKVLLAVGFLSVPLCYGMYKNDTQLKQMTLEELNAEIAKAKQPNFPGESAQKGGYISRINRIIAAGTYQQAGGGRGGGGAALSAEERKIVSDFNQWVESGTLNDSTARALQGFGENAIDVALGKARAGTLRQKNNFINAVSTHQFVAPTRGGGGAPVGGGGTGKGVIRRVATSRFWNAQGSTYDAMLQSIADLSVTLKDVGEDPADLMPKLGQDVSATIQANI